MSYLPKGFPIERLDPIEVHRLEYFYEKFVLDRFGRYGFGHFALACYAALPAVLTPDLLNKIWLNFKSYQLQGQSLDIHSVAPVDLLLSPLLEEIGYELYEMSEPIRASLLLYLQKLNQQDEAVSSVLEFAKLSKVAAFLYNYATKDYTASNTADEAFREAQGWTALSYLNPSLAFKKVLDGFKSNHSNTSQQLRYSDAIKKMSQRFEFQIAQNPDAIPKEFQKFQALISIRVDEILQRPPRALSQLDIEGLRPYLADKADPEAISIAVPQSVKETINAAAKLKRPPKTYALLIGVDPLGTTVQENNIKLFEGCLREFTAKEVLELVTLIDEKATRENILEAWQKIIDEASEVDEVLFYLSAEAAIYTSKHCKVMLDNPNGLSLEDQDIKEIAQKAPHLSITAILDFDHAATEHWLDLSNPKNIVLASCRYDEKNFPFSRQFKRKHYGHFTFALVNTLKRKKSLLSVKVLFGETLLELEKNYLKKAKFDPSTVPTPQLLWSPSFYEIFFLRRKNALVELQWLLSRLGYLPASSISGIWDTPSGKALAAAKAAHPTINVQNQSKKLYNDYFQHLLRDEEAPSRPVFLFVYWGDHEHPTLKDSSGTDLSRFFEGTYVETIVLKNPSVKALKDELKKTELKDRIQLFYCFYEQPLKHPFSYSQISWGEEIIKLADFRDCLVVHSKLHLVFFHHPEAKLFTAYLTQLGVPGGIVVKEPGRFAVDAFFKKMADGLTVAKAYEETIGTSSSNHQGVSFYQAIGQQQKLEDWPKIQKPYSNLEVSKEIHLVFAELITADGKSDRTTIELVYRVEQYFQDNPYVQVSQLVATSAEDLLEKLRGIKQVSILHVINRSPIHLFNGNDRGIEDQLYQVLRNYNRFRLFIVDAPDFSPTGRWSNLRVSTLTWSHSNIFDREHFQFFQIFYQKLAASRTLNVAFQDAHDSLIVLPSERDKIRGANAKNRENPFQIYISTPNSNALDWAFAEELCNTTSTTSSTNTTSNAIVCLQYSPDGRKIISCAENNPAKVYDAETGELILELTSTTNASFAKFSPDGNLIVLGGVQGRIQVFDVSTGETLMSFQGRGKKIRSIDFHPNGEQFAWGGEDGAIRVWDVKKEMLYMTLMANKEHHMLRSLAYSPDGKYMIAAESNIARLWELESGKSKQTFGKPTKQSDLDMRSVGFSSDGKTILLGDRQGFSLQPFNALNLKQSVEINYEYLFDSHLDNPWSSILAHKMSPDNQNIAYGSREGMVHIVDKSQKIPVIHLKGGDSFDFSPDGSKIAIGDFAGTVKTYDTLIGSLIKDFSTDKSKRRDAQDSLLNANSAHLHALLVGIDEYLWSVPSLSGCFNDVQAFKSLLLNQYAYLSPNIMTLINEQATYLGVIRAFRKQLTGKHIKAGDQVLFYFSGRGSNELSAQELGNNTITKDETFICYDSRSPGRNDMADKELVALIAEVPEGVDVLIITDCTHTSSETRTTSNAKSTTRYYTPRDKNTARNINSYLPEDQENFYLKQLRLREKIEVPVRPHVLMTACGVGQDALEAEQQGVFTRCLIDVLQNSGTGFTYNEVWKRTKNLVEKISPQRPNLFVNQAMDSDQVFLSKPRPKQAYFNAFYKNGNWIINCGAINGMPGAPEKLSLIKVALFKSSNTGPKPDYVVNVIAVNADHSILDFSQSPGEYYWAAVGDDWLIQEFAIKARMYFNRQASRWELDKGAINGVSPNWDRLHQQVIVSIPSAEPIKASIKSVFPGFSIVEFELYADVITSERYEALVPSLMRRLLKVCIQGETEGVTQFQKIASPQALIENGIVLVESNQELDYIIRANNGQYIITLPDADQPLPVPVDVYGSSTIVDLQDRLKKLQRWSFIKQLANDSAQNKLGVQALGFELTWNDQRLRPNAEGHYSFEFESPHVPTGEMRLQITNKSNNLLFVGVVYLSNKFDIASDQFWPQPYTVKLLNSQESAFEEYTLQIEDFVLANNWPEEILYFKVIAATSAFDIEFIDQNHSEELFQYRGRPAIGSTTTSNPEDWQTWLLPLHLINPHYEEALWQNVLKLNSIAGYEDYLGKFGKGKYHAPALERLRDLAEEEWRNTSKNLSSLMAFILAPDSPFNEETQRLLAAKETEQDALVYIKGGTFEMGDVMEDNEAENEAIHAVTVSDFLIAKHELTFEEFDVFCRATNHQLPDDKDWGRGSRPVIHVDWYDALEYCNWRSEKENLKPYYIIDKKRPNPNNRNANDLKKWTIQTQEGSNGFRLPTEEEWEFAAREGGKKIRFGSGDDVADPTKINFQPGRGPLKSYELKGIYRQATIPVGSLKAPNALGLHDMSGNVKEWCYDADQMKGNPRSACRGGSWFKEAKEIRCSCRSFEWLNEKSPFIGFRLARSV